MGADLDLLRKWREGDREAGSELLARHFDSVYRFFRNKLGGDFDDLIQRTFLACVESVDRLREEASFRSYLFTVARNELYRHFKLLNRGRRMEVDLGTMSVVELGSSPSSRAVRREEEQLLLEALAKIPVDLQIALELHYWEGLTMEEIGAVLGVPTGTAKSRLRRARLAVEAAMRDCEASPAALASTLDRFEHWAVQVRAAVERKAPPRE